MSFKPSMTSPGSIFLFFVFSCSLFLSILAIIFLLKNGIKTSPSRLVLFMHVSMGAWTTFKMPFVFNGFLCQIAGFVINYSVIQILIITYFLLTSTNIASLISNSEIQKTSECQLDRKSLLIIFLVPLAFALFPFSATEYNKSNGWCVLDHDSNGDVAIIFLSFVCLWCFQLIILYQLYKVLKKIWDYPTDVFYETVQRVLYGPTLYATFTTIIFICIDVVIIYAASTQYEKDSMANYYLEYTYAILQYVLGMGYAAIYFFEKDNLKVTLCYF